MKTSIKILFGFCLCFFIASDGFTQVTDQDRTDKNNTFNTWDTNADSRVDRNEFNATFRDNNPYADWDANSDNRLDENEWNDNFTSHYTDREIDDNLYSDWDTNGDNYLDDNEYREGTYDLWDENDDGYIDNDEYSTWNDDDID